MSFYFAIVALALVFATSPAGADVDNDICLACHEGEPVGADAFTASVHGDFTCTTCHSDADEGPHEQTPARVGPDTCSTCHADIVEAYAADIHGQAAGRGVDAAPRCADCHGDIHTAQAHTQTSSPTHWSKVAATCARCHQQEEIKRGFRIPVARAVETYLESVHALAVGEGRRGAECSDCHGAHGIFPGADPRSTIWRPTVPETCGQCHAEILTAYRRSVHAQAVAAGVREAPVCTDCHGEHRILGPNEPSSPVSAANIAGETCGRCHGDERLSAKYGLDATKVATFRDSYHGLALRGGAVAVANCSSCHGIHDILPSSDPRSSIHPANLPQTCGACHPGAGTRVDLGPVHTSPTSRASGAIYWVRAVYLWLIAVTIGFMLVHNGLDLRRKAARTRTTAAQVRERMPRVLRWQHRLVMISFPLLVYSGFALTYPESWWAAPLLYGEPHVQIRSLLHRAAAVVLLVAVAWHVVLLAWNGPLRSCLRGLLPARADLTALGAALAHYLGWRDERPIAGRFSYIEKMEYWAFLWGVVLMSATGFLLWFENTTLRNFPKWVADVAVAIHFYEAILAALAIVVWHFYWVMLDPDVYPMDWSWLTGRSPASRAEERGDNIETTDDTPATE